MLSVGYARCFLCFVTYKPFMLNVINQMFVSNAGARAVKLSGASRKGRLLALPSNIRLGCKGLPGTNSLPF